MIDLIDRARLLNSRVYSTRKGKPNYEKMLKNLVNDILTAPTVDTERHAHWIKGKIPYEEYTCSNCGGACWYYDYSGTVCKSKYCPNCGCKMDEVVKCRKK